MPHQKQKEPLTYKKQLLDPIEGQLSKFSKKLYQLAVKSFDTHGLLGSKLSGIGMISFLRKCFLQKAAQDRKLKRLDRLCYDQLDMYENIYAVLEHELKDKSFLWECDQLEALSLRFLRTFVDRNSPDVELIENFLDQKFLPEVTGCQLTVDIQLLPAGTFSSENPNISQLREYLLNQKFLLEDNHLLLAGTSGPENIFRTYLDGGCFILYS